MVPLAGVSVFDGHGGMFRAFKPHGAERMEILRDAVNQDILRPQGTLRWLTHVKATMPDGLHWFGPPCGSWGFLTRSKSKRTKDNVLGNRFDPWVRTHNSIAEWVAMAIVTLTWCGIYFVIENPSGSLIFDHPAIAQALVATKARKVGVSLFGWGHPSSKPLVLAGTAPWLEKLEEASRDLALANRDRHKTTLATTNETGAVTGNSDDLKESAIYPDEFCELVAKYHTEFMSRQHREDVPAKRRRLA